MRNFDNAPSTERMARRGKPGRFVQTTHHRPRSTRGNRTRAAAMLAVMWAHEHEAN